MSNTLTGLVPTLYESLDIVSRELVGAISAVTRDSTVARAAKGQVVDSFTAPAVTASDITPGVTAPNDGDQVLGNVQLTITKSRYVPIRWNGEEQRGLNNGGPGARAVLTNQFAQAYRTLVNEVEVDLVTAMYKGASRAIGTAATTPFGTAADLSDVAGAATVLDVNGMPMGDRQLVLGSSAIGNLRGKQSLLFKVNEAGDDRLLREGVIGRLEGFDVHNSAGVRVVTKGTGANYLINGTLAVGATTITVDTGTGTILAGDHISIAGDTNVYVVNTALAAGSFTIGAPGLLVAPADNAAVTVGGSFTPNIALNKSAVILATRAPAVPIDINGNAMDMAEDRVMVTDPVSNLSFEVAMYLQYRQIKYEVGLAWGQGVVKSDGVVILRG